MGGSNYNSFCPLLCVILRDLVPSLQFKKHEKHPWKSITFRKTKSNTPTWVFFTFFKMYKWYQIAQQIAYCHENIAVKEHKIHLVAFPINTLKGGIMVLGVFRRTLM